MTPAGKGLTGTPVAFVAAFRVPTPRSGHINTSGRCPASPICISRLRSSFVRRFSERPCRTEVRVDDRHHAHHVWTPRASSVSQPSSSSPSGGSALKSTFALARQVISIAMLVILQRWVTSILVAFNISFPAPLATMLLTASAITLFRVLRLSFVVDRVIGLAFTPGVSLLSKWLAVFFVPNLVMLPLAPKLPSADLSRLIMLIPAAYLTTVLGTVVICSLLGRISGSASSTNAKETSVAKPVAATPAAKSAGPSDTLISILMAIVAGSLILAGRTASVSNVYARIYAVATTLLTFSVGSRLPGPVRIVLHPLIVCTAGTIGGMSLLSMVTGKSFSTALSAYYVRGASAFAGGGNMLCALLGPAVITFAFTMDRHRRLALQRRTEVVLGSLIIALSSLFGTAAAARMLKLSTPSRLMVIPRTVTAPLAVPIAALLGADVGLAASIVALTGLLGANVGRAVLNLARVNDPVVRGLAMGASAHGLGTAAMGEEPESLPFSALAMTMVGVLSSILVSVPPLRAALIRLALGSRILS